MWWVSSPTEPASKSHFPRSAGEKETSREILIGVPSYHFPLPAAEIITDHKPIQLHGFFTLFSNCVFWSIRRIENWRSANASQLEDLDSADAKVPKNSKIQAKLRCRCEGCGTNEMARYQIEFLCRLEEIEWDGWLPMQRGSCPIWYKLHPHLPNTTENINIEYKC